MRSQFGDWASFAGRPRLRAHHGGRGRPTRSRPGSRQGSARRRGQSLVEMVFATPILLLLLLGTIDVGRLFFGYVEMTNAVREGAGYAAHRPAETEEIMRRVTRHAAGLPEAAIHISCSNGSCASAVAGDRVTVSASWTFEPLTGALLSAFFAMPRFDIHSSTTMRVL